MKTRLIRIGNGKGLRIPKALIEQSGLKDEVEVTLEGDSLVNRAVMNPRDGWAEAFEIMARRSDDAMLDTGMVNAFDDTDWEW